MQRFLLAAFLFLSAGLSAQVDSFMVEGKKFIVPIPQDWVLEEKADELQNDSSWNFVLHYGIDSRELNARIGVKVESRPAANDEPVVFKQKTKLRYGYLNMGRGEGAFAHVESPSIKCTDCQKKYTDINLYYLDPKLNLVLAFSGSGKKPVLDSLQRAFVAFRKEFFDYNAATINAFRPLLSVTPFSVTDSFNSLHRYYRMTHEPGWTCIADKDSNMQMTRAILSSPELVFTISLAVKKEPEAYAENNPLIHCKSQLSYAVYPDSIKNGDHFLVFSLCPANGDFPGNDYLLNQYYRNLLEDLIAKFLHENDLAWTFTDGIVPSLRSGERKKK